MTTTARTARILVAACSLGAFGCIAEPTPEDDDDLEVAVEESALTRAEITDRDPWVVRLDAGSKGCTGVVLSSHWILTAAHCANVAQSTELRVSQGLLPSTPGGPAVMRGLYSGPARYFPHPAWDTTAVGGLYLDTDADDDIGLIHIDRAVGLDLARTGQANLFADSREPYHGSGDRSFHILGYGKGTNPGGSSDCDDGTTRGKRIGFGFKINVSSDGYQSHAPYGSTHPCPGDSGGPWMFSRGGLDMVFGIMSSMRQDTWVTSPKMWSALVPPRKTWIETRTASVAHPLTCTARLAAGWRYLRCNEPSTTGALDIDGLVLSQ
jgi:hypothetical protein